MHYKVVEQSKLTKQFEELSLKMKEETQSLNSQLMLETQRHNNQFTMQQTQYEEKLLQLKAESAKLQVPYCSH